MAIAEQLVGKSDSARATLKAEAIKTVVDAAMGKTGTKWKFTLKDGRGVTVEAVRMGLLSIDEPTKIVTFARRTDGGADPIWVKLSVDGKYLNGDGWYGFVNPPILVPDGPSAFKEDLVAAAKTIFANAVGGAI
jgi:hypothetical protein